MAPLRESVVGSRCEGSSAWGEVSRLMVSLQVQASNSAMVAGGDDGRVYLWIAMGVGVLALAGGAALGAVGTSAGRWDAGYAG